MSFEGKPIDAIADPNIRDAIENLQIHGWTLSLTAQGHLRLSHPEASHPVSCTIEEVRKRGPEALKRVCNLVVERSRAKVAAEAEYERNRLAAEAEYAKRQEEKRRTARPVAQQVATRPALRSVPQSDAPKLAPSPAPASTEVSGAVQALVVKPEPQPQALSAPVIPTHQDIQILPSDVLALARKIAAGEVSQIIVTPDMLGKTMLIDGKVLLVEDGPVPSGRLAGLPAKSAVADMAASGAPEKPVSGAGKKPVSGAGKGAKSTGNAEPGTFKLGPRHTFLLDLLTRRLPDYLTTQEIAQLHWRKEGFASVKSAYASFRQGLALLASLGYITEVRQNGTYRYMAVQKA
jgi:hypothetical protein